MTPQQLKNAILQQAIQGKLVEQRAEEGTGEELYKAIQDEKQKLIQEESSRNKKLSLKSQKTKSPLRYQRLGSG